MNHIKDIHFFHFPEIPLSGAFEAEGPEVHHMIRVLRHKAGDELDLCDGKGTYFKSRILQANKNRVTIDVLSHVDAGSLPVPLAVAIAPTKNMDRFEWFLEKATEIGVGQIIPLLTERSERKTIKLERCEKIILSAMKQSGRAWKPECLPLKPFDECISTTPELSYIAHCASGDKLAFEKTKPDGFTRLYIGPEGDFSSQEIEAAKRKGILSVSLGNSRLRTETAGVVACTMFDIMNK